MSPIPVELLYNFRFLSFLLPGVGHGGADHVLRAGVSEDPDALRQRGAGGADIVDQQHTVSPDLLGTGGLIDAQHVGPPGRGVVDAGLGGVICDFAQQLYRLCVPEAAG